MRPAIFISFPLCLMLFCCGAKKEQTINSLREDSLNTPTLNEISENRDTLTENSAKSDPEGSDNLYNQELFEKYESLRILNDTGTEISNYEFRGFVFINIRDIYYSGRGKVEILNQNGETLISIQDTTISVNGKLYGTINEDYLLKKLIHVYLFEPEYSFFVLRCYGIKDDYFEIELDDTIGLINRNLSPMLVEFKDFRTYLMENYPIPTALNPVMSKPDESSIILEGYDNWTYLPLEIEGDWVKVRDDKDCYPGVGPSEMDIIYSVL